MQWSKWWTIAVAVKQSTAVPRMLLRVGRLRRQKKLWHHRRQHHLRRHRRCRPRAWRRRNVESVFGFWNTDGRKRRRERVKILHTMVWWSLYRSYAQQAWYTMSISLIAPPLTVDAHDEFTFFFLFILFRNKYYMLFL